MVEICNFSAAINYSDPANYDYFENCTTGGEEGGPIGPQKVPNKDIETSFKLLLYIIAFLQNIILLYVILRDPMKRFRNPPSYFIANFTIADTLSIVSGMCDSVFQLNPREHYEKQEISGCLQGIGIQASFIIIIIFAVDRHLAIGHPFTYRNLLESKVTLVILLVIPWCLGVIILPIIYFSPSHGTSLTKLFAGDIIALTCITLVVNPLTYFKFRRKMKNMSNNEQRSLENLKIEKVLATTVVIVSFSLILFMFPYLVAFCFHVSNCTRCFLNKTFLSFWTYYPLLTAIRLLTNSAIYAWRLPLYWQSLKLLSGSRRIRGNSGSNQSNGTQSLNSSINATPMQPRFHETGLNNRQNNRNILEMKEQTLDQPEKTGLNNRQIDRGTLKMKEQTLDQPVKTGLNNRQIDRGTLKMKEQILDQPEESGLNDRQCSNKNMLEIKKHILDEPRIQETGLNNEQIDRNMLEIKEQSLDQPKIEETGLNNRQCSNRNIQDSFTEVSPDQTSSEGTGEHNKQEDELGIKENNTVSMSQGKVNYGLQDMELYSKQNNNKTKSETKEANPKPNKQSSNKFNNDVKIDLSSTQDSESVFDEKF